MQAPEFISRGPRDVLRYIEEFLAWQDAAVLALNVQVDGEWYVPAWIFDDRGPCAT